MFTQKGGVECADNREKSRATSQAHLCVGDLRCARIAHLQTTPSETISGVLHLLKNYVRWVLLFILSKRSRKRNLQSDWLLALSGFSRLCPDGHGNSRAMCVWKRSSDMREKNKITTLFTVLVSICPYTCGEKLWPQTWKSCLGLRPWAVFSRPRSHSIIITIIFSVRTLEPWTRLIFGYNISFWMAAEWELCNLTRVFQAFCTVICYHSCLLERPSISTFFIYMFPFDSCLLFTHWFSSN